jgi:tetratricopeptide (TPR) repeat protein
LDGLTILYVLAALVTIGTPSYFTVRWLVRRRRGTDSGIEAVRQIVEEAVRPVKDELARVTEYLDGLPEAPPKIKDPFNEGQKLEKENKYKEAIKQYEACFQTETTASQRAALHILIGNCYLSLSELEEAEGHYKEAETAAKEADDKEGLAAALGNIGLIYQTKGELDKALDYHQQSLKIEREIGRKVGEASHLGNIGLIYQSKGELDKALDYLQPALSIDR